jgi:hypothetical protein
LMLSCSIMRITNTTRNSSGRLSIARSSRSRTWLRVADRSGSSSNARGGMATTPASSHVTLSGASNGTMMRSRSMWLTVVLTTMRVNHVERLASAQNFARYLMRSDRPPASRPRHQHCSGRSPERPGRAAGCDAARSGAARTHSPHT